MSTKSRKRQKETQRGEEDNALSALGSLVRGWLPVVVGMVVVVGAGLWFGGLIPTGGGDDGKGAPAARAASSSSSNSASSSTQWDQALPSFITNSPTEVQEAYAFVAANPNDTQYIPCYCGCGEHSGHRWIRDCFVKDWSQTGIKYDDHGSGCDICVNIALELKNGLAKGQTLPAIRKTVDSKYSKFGGGTDTPLPPG